MKGGGINIFQGVAILVIIATIVTVIVLWQKGMFNKKDSSAPAIIGPGGQRQQRRPIIYN